MTISRAEKLMAHSRRRAYDIFSKLAGATLDELVIPLDNPISSTWVWLVNLGEMGRETVEAKLVFVEHLIGPTTQITWVPLVGFPYSLVYFPDPTDARSFVSLHHAALSDPTYILANSKPRFVELAYPAAVKTRLPMTPSGSSLESSIELAPGRRRWDCGVEVWNDFVSEEEEQMLIGELKRVGKWKDGEIKRVSVHFGPHFDYTTNATKELLRPLPSYTLPIMSRLPYIDTAMPPDQMTGQLYPPGSGIPPHVDTHSPFGPVLWGISLGTAVTMELKEAGPTEARRMREPKRSLAASSSSPSPTPVPTPPPLETLNSPQQTIAIDLAPRSLLILRGSSRYAYTHSIRPRRLDPLGKWGETLRERGERYSLTFRCCVAVENRKCQCEWPAVCDTRIEEERRNGSN